ncbi:MAG: hydrogenase iron-sulfur subunit [Chitinivibrionales bacterium]|nr:hydrogenase iron-sulfur subunit [Chitinivibrionales bacterium]
MTLPKTKPVKSSARALRQNVAILGGGIAAMTTANALAGRNYKVSLVFSGAQLGGNARAFPELFGHIGNDLKQSKEQILSTITNLEMQINNQRSIELFPESTAASVKGEAGNFKVMVSSQGKTFRLSAGAVVLAAGTNGIGAQNKTGLTLGKNLIAFSSLLSMIREGKTPKKTAFLLDGAAEQDCATSAAVFSCALLLAQQPKTSSTVFCKNARVAAFGMENLYRRARNAGVEVVKYDSLTLQRETAAGIAVITRDTIADKELCDEFETVVYADRSADSPRIPSITGLKTAPDGSLQYDNVWLLPAQTNRAGIFTAGASRGITELREVLNDGLAVAGQVHDFLRQGQLVASKDAANVDAEKCALCLTCLRICPVSAISIDTKNKAATVSPYECQKCGACAAECPALAITLPGFSDEQIQKKVGDKPKTIVFACENSAIPAMQGAGKLPASVAVITVPCAGKVDPRAVLQALHKGANKVMVLGCHPESCRYLSGGSRASKRMERLRETLDKAGFNKERVVFGGLAALETGRFLEYVSSNQTMAGQVFSPHPGAAS